MRLSDREWRNMKNTMIRAMVGCLIIFQLFTALPCLAAESGQQNPEISFYTSKAGNVFGPLDAVSFIGRYENNSNSEIAAVVNFNVVNSRGEEVWSASDREITIPQNSVCRIPVTPKGDFRGMYTLNASVSVNDDTIDTSVSFYVAENEMKNESLGSCTHFAFKNPTVNTDDVSAGIAAGLSFMRDECWWGDVETSKGVYKIPKRISDFVDYAYENGIEILMPLTYSNGLYCDKITSGQYAGGYKMPYTDEQIEAYAAYCGYLAREFKGKVKYFEVWNEPDGVMFNHDLSNTGSPETYAKLLKAAYEAIKAENPDAYVLGIAASGIDHSAWFINRVLAAGGGDYMDALSVHPYTWTREPADERGQSFEYLLNILYTIMKNNNVDLPIWITEIGYSSGEVSESEDWLTEEQQGAYNVRTCVFAKADSKIEKTFLYELKDRGSGIEKTYNMGMIDFDGSLKPAYYMLAAYNDIVGNAAYKGRAERNIQKTVDKYYSNDNGIRYSGYSVHRFNDAANDREIFMAWTKGDNTYNTRITTSGSEFTVSDTAGNLTIDLGKELSGKNITLYDAYGNLMSGAGITLDFKPVYIVCEDIKELIGSSLKMTISKNTLVAEGYTDVAGAMPTVKVLDNIYNEDQPIYYINQTAPDSDGYYRFDIPLADINTHKMYLYDGTAINTELFNNAAMVEIAKNGETVYDLENLKAGDKLTVRVELADASKKGVLMCATYDETNGALTGVAVSDIVLDGEKAAAKTELTVANGNQNIKIFMMDYTLRPLFGVIGQKNQ